MRNIATAALSLTLLVGCTQGQGESVTTVAGVSTQNLNDPSYQLLVTCRAWDTTLRSLAGYRAQGKLSKEDVATVDKWRPIITESCKGSSTTDIEAALDAAEQALQQMVLVEQNVAKK
jgi:hypothetical protein